MANFGDKLREFRKSAGKTQGEMGRDIGVPQSTVSKWEKSLQTPSAEHAARLQDLIGMPIAELLGLEIQVEPQVARKQGLGEMKQSAFNAPLKGSTAIQGETGAKPSRHPAFGVWKGKVTLLPDHDYTQPADPDWGKVYED